MSNRKTILALTLALLAGCAATPSTVVPSFDSSRNYAMSKEEIWPDVIDFFAARNIPISTLEMDSGIVAADNLRLGIEESQQLMSCSWRMSVLIPPTWQPLPADLNIFVRESAPDAVTVTVNTRYAANFFNALNGLYLGQEECRSLGALETQFLDTIGQDAVGPTR